MTSRAALAALRTAARALQVAPAPIGVRTHLGIAGDTLFAFFFEKMAIFRGAKCDALFRSPRFLIAEAHLLRSLHEINENSAIFSGETP